MFLLLSVFVCVVDAVTFTFPTNLHIFLLLPFIFWCLPRATLATNNFNGRHTKYFYYLVQFQAENKNKIKSKIKVL